MGGLKKIFCQHNNVYVKRVHLDSELGKANREKYMYVDIYNCANLICCTECDKVLGYESREPIYERQKNT